MLTMALPSFVSLYAAIAGLLVAVLSVFIVRKPREVKPHNPEAEWRIIRTRVSGHPWRARLMRLERWMGGE